MSLSRHRCEERSALWNLLFKYRSDEIPSVIPSWRAHPSRCTRLPASKSKQVCEVGVLGQGSRGGIDVLILQQMIEPWVITRKKAAIVVQAGGVLLLIALVFNEILTPIDTRGLVKTDTW